MFQRLAIPEVFTYTPKRFGDARGQFAETFNRALLEPMTGSLEWVQDNHSVSAKGVLRGLHFQAPPFAQDKLVRCVRGAVLDVAVDLRHGSPTFGAHVTAKLSAENGVQIFVPKGFAHGFLALESDTEVIYKVSVYYNAPSECSVRWDDPELGIDWGVEPHEVALSPKDEAALSLANSPAVFHYPG